MNSFKYFKITFLSVGAGLIAASIVIGLFDINLNDWSAIGELLLKSAVKGIVVGALLGLMNMYFKVWPFDIKKKGE